MNIPIEYVGVLLIALWGLFYALFHQCGKLHMFLVPQKFIFLKFLSLLAYIFIRPVVRGGKAVFMRWYRELYGIAIGSIATALIFVYVTRF